MHALVASVWHGLVEPLEDVRQAVQGGWMGRAVSSCGGMRVRVFGRL